MNNNNIAEEDWLNWHWQVQHLIRTKEAADEALTLTAEEKAGFDCKSLRMPFSITVVIWRITCESAILLFGIYDRLGDIKAALKGDETKKLATFAAAPAPKAVKEPKAAKKPAKKKAKKAKTKKA